MKNLKYSVFVFMAAALTSCSLDRQPLTALSDETFWEDASKAELALTACYRGNMVVNSEIYEPYDVWTYYGLVLMDHLSDNCFDRRGVNNAFFMISSGGLVAGNAQMKDYWTSEYKRIGYCNRFIAGMSSVDNPDVTMIGEARFLRATMYHYLASYYKDVPLVTTPISNEEASVLTKTSQSEILEWCAQELEEAAAQMPTFANAKKGHANRQAALAFLGRTRMLQKKWSEAADAFKRIIDLGENSIHPVYKEVFLPGIGIANNENIFYISYLKSYFGSGFAQHCLSDKDGGWSLSNPTASLFEEYEFIDGTPFGENGYDDPRFEYPNLGKNRDPRLDYTLYYNGATVLGTEYKIHPDNAYGSCIQVNYGEQNSRTGFMPRKYVDEENGYAKLSDHDMVIPIIRYADVLLSYLECLVESGSPVTQDILNQTINAVRGRSDVNMPAVTVTDAAVLRERVRHERRVELAYEGTRYWDLLRWGIAHEVLNGDIWGAAYPDANYAKDFGGEGVNSPRKQDPTGHNRWYVGERNFRNPQDYQWPIPQSEQNLNPNLRSE